MSYEIINPPFTLKFREMSRKELKAYFDWFQSTLPHRIAELAAIVREAPGFESWVPDFSPTSLDALGAWFGAQVETRSRTMDEVGDIRSQSSHPIDVRGEELTNRSFSLAMDVGMYLSEVFLRNHPTVRWDQIFGNRQFIDYGQPVLVGFGDAPFNPVHMLVTLAYGVASGKKDGTGLPRIYDVWSKLVR